MAAASGIFSPQKNYNITTTESSQNVGPFSVGVYAIRVSNTGTAALVCSLGVGEQTAVAGSGFVMPPNSTEYFEVSSLGTEEFACLTASAGNVVSITEMI
jgi:hypothetical protein